jgi:hypothetical protein
MCTVAEVDVSRAGSIPRDESACARSRERVTSLVVLSEVGFRFHNFSGAFTPNQSRADEVVRARDGITLKKNASYHSPVHANLARGLRD